MSHFATLTLPNNSSLSPLEPKDRGDLVKHLADKDIYDMTLAFPHPYTLKDADDWISKNQSSANVLAIRNSNAELIGNIGLLLENGKLKANEGILGYWLAKPYWGKGIATSAVKMFCPWAMQEFRLQTLHATTFKNNIGSQRVLEKAGFKNMGIRKNAHVKDGKNIDATVWVLGH